MITIAPIITRYRSACWRTPSRNSLLVGVAGLLAMPAFAQDWPQSSYPSPSSYPARPAYRTQSGYPPVRTRPLPPATPPVNAPPPEAMPDGPPPGVAYDPQSAAMSDAPAPDISTAPPLAMPADAGPRGTSGTVRLDRVGYAGGWQGGETNGAIVVAQPDLDAGSYVELTALDSGRTIAAIVAARGGSGIADLSPGAAAQLGVEPGAAIRIRTITPSPQDQGALRAGRPAATRIAAPQGLLVALRQQLPGRGGATASGHPHPAAPPTPPRRPPPALASRGGPGAGYAPPGAPSRAPAAGPDRQPMERPPAPPVHSPAVRGHFYVQAAALSSAGRAQGLVRSLGAGRVVPVGGIYRVQIGPYADVASAHRARDGIARRGYGDARVVID